MINKFNKLMQFLKFDISHRIIIFLFKDKELFDF
jgi:hypothetical protein